MRPKSIFLDVHGPGKSGNGSASPLISSLPPLGAYMKKNKEVNKHLTTYLESKTNLLI